LVQELTENMNKLAERSFKHDDKKWWGFYANDRACRETFLHHRTYSLGHEPV
jgi:hypothetical protein